MNNFDILWIDEDYVKKYSTVLENVDIKFIKSHIIEAQNIYIQENLGGWMYEDIINEYLANSNSGSTISSKYITLVNDYIKPILLYYTIYESLYDLYAKTTNKGLEIQVSEGNSAVSEGFLEKRMTKFKNKAEFYEERCIDFLRQNQDTYTKWRDNDPNNPYRIEPEKDTSYRNGMYIIGQNTRSNICVNKRNLKNI